MGVQERREREREARKDAVLDAAREILLEKGFRGTTTKAIAARCELSEATLFFYFNNKDEILASLLFESIGFWGEGLDK
ncbi:MAG TPA: helix-turn-helix domain-containing protein, partial [Arenicellales bacterium]|nr:helix-turn-helix domain-containing protein [Arenicellales bacterium]